MSEEDTILGSQLSLDPELESVLTSLADDDDLDDNASHSTTQTQQGPRPIRGKRFVFTLNNPTQSETEALTLYLQRPEKVEYAIFGREIGSNGTPHLQGFVCFVRRHRFPAVKEIIGRRAHIETARGSPSSNRKYCSKGSGERGPPDYVEFGTIPEDASTIAKRACQWTEFNTWISECTERPSIEECWSRYPRLCGQYANGVRERLGLWRPPRRDESTVQLRPWQHDLRERVLGDADDRTIHFVVDETGGQGKTFFSKYMWEHHEDKVQLLGVGKNADIAYMLDPDKKIFLFDVPRSAMQYLDYRLLEKIKDGMVISTKYQSHMKVLFHTAHVIVLCNEEPDRAMLSADRYNIIRPNVFEHMQQANQPSTFNLPANE